MGFCNSNTWFTEVPNILSMPAPTQPPKRKTTEVLAKPAAKVPKLDSRLLQSGGL